jgi:SpoVK/Ycf46/Vps4 family AAA+-type ATPase
MRFRRVRARAGRAAIQLADPVVPLYVRNLARAFGPEGWSELDPRVRHSAAMHKALGLPPPSRPVEAPSRDPDDIPFESPDELAATQGGAVLAAVERLQAEPLERPASIPLPIDRPLGALCRQLGLSRVDREILRLLVCARLKPFLDRTLWSLPGNRLDELAGILAAATGHSHRAVRERIGPDAPLFSTGLVSFTEPDVPFDAGLGVDGRVVELAVEGLVERDAILSRFLTVEPEPSLQLRDFAHLDPQLAAARGILEGAFEDQAVGVNLLFHGATGCGKTEAARLLAASLGARLYLAGAADEAGNPPNAQERLTSLALVQRIVASARAIVSFDETEDIAPGPVSFFGVEVPSEGRVSKIWMTRRLERNPVPTIWLTNRIDALDPAFVRRFSLVVHFPQHGPAQRKAVWTRHGHGQLSPQELDELAGAYEVSPGEIAGALRSARLAGGGTVDGKVLRQVLDGAVQASRGKRQAPTRRAGAEYRLEAVNASTDLIALADRLARWQPGAGVGLSLCLYGRSGTGKSEFVHHLGKRMGRPVIAVRISSLLDKYLGETEKRIAAAFAQAEATGAILLLDEADAILRDRRGAQQSWELSIVNEVLQQLEAFRGFVACTTNLFDDLDQAALRRFAFKVEFLPLRPEQAAALFDAHLAPLLPSPLGAEAQGRLAAGLRRIGPTTPGDFAVVARRAGALGGGWSLEALLAEVEQEVRCRGAEGAAIGF